MVELKNALRYLTMELEGVNARIQRLMEQREEIDNELSHWKGWKHHAEIARQQLHNLTASDTPGEPPL